MHFSSPLPLSQGADDAQATTEQLIWAGKCRKCYAKPHIPRSTSLGILMIKIIILNAMKVLVYIVGVRVTAAPRQDIVTHSYFFIRLAHENTYMSLLLVSRSYHHIIILLCIRMLFFFFCPRSHKSHPHTTG